jgi:hypothetical protein
LQPCRNGAARHKNPSSAADAGGEDERGVEQEDGKILGDGFEVIVD